MNLIKSILRQRFVRFLLIGGINTIFGYGVFALFIFLGLHYTLASFFGTVLGILFNFQTVGRLVFFSYRNDLIFKFILVYLVTYLCNIFGLYLFNIFNISNYLAGAILILPVAFLAYFLNKMFVYNIIKE